ncbi:RNA-binding domain-containing protein [Metschnikowia bicuspidata var. bicuspidata NRRL YB-4993]|uniref:RNA-binding domain-containing protein n=1 Tax=Metschnikowia bicuspidata var. bicuspidata NRRL YB-4993 TaxID=869754 RepID=A0A1A0H854_9ASCO|nr:RNA-binding domain-containing protein [Metschnikowia bicuspidata var. bicuspidata NRRL YB-4993]OBA20072.1 RNA-binding domain-containing protein [Metschnikowia bicuspidata var. bicuspidata NRRL YB-4993]
MNVFRKSLEQDRNVHATIYVGNLDTQVTEALLYELFIQVGPVRLLYLPKDRVLRTHQGFGFVEFRGIEDADFALNLLRGVRLYGRTLKMKKTDPQSNSSNSPEFKHTAGVGARLFIKNLHQLVDEKYLQNTFSAIGNLINQPIIIRDEKGHSKGYGFIEFGDFESSDKAIERLNGAIFMNNRITLSYAYKEGQEGKKIQHGDHAERTLAKQGNKHLKKEPATRETRSSRNR